MFQCELDRLYSGMGVNILNNFGNPFYYLSNKLNLSFMLGFRRGLISHTSVMPFIQKRYHIGDGPQYGNFCCFLSYHRACHRIAKYSNPCSQFRSKFCVERTRDYQWLLCSLFSNAWNHAHKRRIVYIVCLRHIYSGINRFIKAGNLDFY